MFQTTVKIHGMASSSGGALICGKIRKHFPEAKKVTASFRNGMVSFETASPVDPEELRTVIDDTGYKYVACETVEFERRSPFRKR